MEKTDGVVSLLANLTPANPTRSVQGIGQILHEIVFALEGDELRGETCLHQGADGSIIAGLKEFEDFIHSLS